MLQFILSDVPNASSLREKTVFVIIPMMNPDGVIMGNYRTGFSGNDLNRQFQDPDPNLHPTVAGIKSLLSRIGKEREILTFLDLHAHSKKKNVFMYGPRYPLHSDNYYEMRVIPKLMCERGPEFRYAACRFKTEASKQRAARLVIWKELKLANCYTIEASFYGYLTPDRVTISFSDRDMEKTGEEIAQAILQYIQLKEEEDQTREARRALRRSKREKTLFPQSQKPTGNIELQVQQKNMEEVIEQIKQEEETRKVLGDDGNRSESGSESSESNEDDLTVEDQKRLHGQILAALQEGGDRIKPKLSRPGAKSTLKPRILKSQEPSPEPVSAPERCIHRETRLPDPRLYPRKNASERVLEAKLYTPSIPLQPITETAPYPRPVSVLRQVRVDRSKGNFSIYRGEGLIEPRHFVVRSQQTGLSQTENRSFTSVSPCNGIQKPRLEEYKERSDSALRKPVIKIRMKPHRPEMPKALTDRIPGKETGWRPLSSVLSTGKFKSSDYLYS